jgi:phosphosulfolactate synthase (CoM biosynthesis protein A)
MNRKEFIFIGDLDKWLKDKTTIEIEYFKKVINEFIEENNIVSFDVIEIERIHTDSKCKVVKLLTW